jgi:hypothetical protein
MPILEEFESSASQLERLLDSVCAFSGQDTFKAFTPEWMAQTNELLGRVIGLIADPRFVALKSSPHVQQYRSALLRLKTMVEPGLQQLVSRRKFIQAEQSRLKRVKALTGTLRSMQ